MRQERHELELGAAKTERLETAVEFFRDEEPQLVKFFDVVIGNIGRIDAADGHDVVFAMCWIGRIPILQEDL